MLVIVAYDVSNRKRRDRLRRALFGYGDPVQESIFACEATDEQLREIKVAVRAVIDPGRDRVDYYPLCAHCRARVEDELARRRPLPKPEIVV